MQIDKPTVIRALSKVIDPISGQDILTASMIRDVRIEGQQIHVEVEPPKLEPEQKNSLNFSIIQAVEEAAPGAEVNVLLITNTPKAQQKPKSLPQVRNIIAVASGKGGVGKSTVAVNLALGLKSLGAKVGLLDADLWGPSIPTMLGLKGKKPKITKVYNQNRIVPIEGYDMPVMSVGFVVDSEQAVVLRGPRLGGILRQFLNDVLWPPLDYLVIDLPPGTGDVQLSLVQAASVTGVVIVTTPQEVAVVDAIKAMNMFMLDNIQVPILGVVENMSWFTPAELPDHRYKLFGEGGGKTLAKQSNSMLLGQIPLVQSVREGGDNGRPIMLTPEHPAAAPFLEVAKNTARQIAIRNEMMPPTKLVEIKN